MKYTIIITAYNSDKYISRCLDSIVNQTVKNFKVIVIDDGSTDDTKKIIHTYMKDNKYIEYYYKKNSGVADTRNFGINKVKTPYFMFVDSDDYITLDLMETIEQYDTDYDILSFKAYMVGQNEDYCHKLEKEDFNIVDGMGYMRYLISHNSFYAVPWGYVYKTKFWKQHKFKYEKDYVLEDTSLTPIVIINAKIITSIDYYGYYYVQTSESITRTNNKEKIKFNMKCALFQYDYVTNYIDNFQCSEKFRKIFHDYFANYLVWYGSKIPLRHIKSFAKELEKRDIVNKFLNKYYKDDIKIKICRVSYIAYLLKTRAYKEDLRSIYWEIRISGSKIYWFIRGVISKIYWGIRSVISKCYWGIKSVISKCYWGIRSIISKCYWPIKGIGSKIYWSVRSIANKCYWGIRSVISKCYWGIKSVISKCYWGIRSIISKCYWPIKGIGSKIYWSIKNILSKLYWKIKNFFNSIFRKIKNIFSVLIRKTKTLIKIILRRV